jgi:hypothetical protein
MLFSSCPVSYRATTSRSLFRRFLERFAAQVVHLSQKSGIDTPHSARIELDLGDGYLALLGYFSGKDEFMEEARERPFGEAT